MCRPSASSRPRRRSLPAARPSLKSSGDKGADLLSAIVGPLLIIGIGVLSLVALLQRNAGMALAAVAIGILAGLPIFAPGTVEGLMKDLYDSVF